MRRVAAFLLLMLSVGGAAYYHFVYRPRHLPPAEVAYILPDTAAVVNAPSQVRVLTASVKHGEGVEVLERARNWARVRLADGVVGWVEADDLLDARSYERGLQLLRELEIDQPQAVGHTGRTANLRLEASRDAPALAELPANQSVTVFRRQVVERPPPSGASGPGASPRDVWYLVRADSRAGWVLGSLVALDIPEEISSYAQGFNLVAWLVLNTVDDEGGPVPQYLVADRAGTQEADFTRIRVLTWWAKNQQYATAYVESNLNGYFPLRTLRRDDVPHFRLRLVDRDGRRVQKVYGMFNTIVRSLGIVEGWESAAVPARPVSGRGRRP